MLTSDRAIAVNIEIMRSFVRIRRLLEADKSLAHKFERLERKLLLTIRRSSAFLPQFAN